MSRSGKNGPCTLVNVTVERRFSATDRIGHSLAERLPGVNRARPREGGGGAVIMADEHARPLTCR